MAESCKLSPTVTRRNGTEIEEKSSKLFNDIKKATKDNETAWTLWAYTKTSEFRAEYKDKVEYDELGEVTFPSLIKALGLENVYNSQKDIEEVSRDYGFTNKIFKNPETVVQEINRFNSKEKRFIASSEKTEDGYKINITKRDAQSVQIARQQSYNSALTGEIIRLLNAMGFNVDWVTNPKYEGLFDPENAKLYDGLITIINLAKGEVGERALPEEFSHLIIEGLIGHPLVQRLLDTLDSTLIREILGDNYDRYAELYDNDGLKLKKEAAGKLLAEHINAKGTIIRPVMESSKPLLSRIWNWVKNLFSRISSGQLAQARLNAYNAIAEIYDMITNEEVVKLVDKESILNAKQLFKLKEEYNDLAKVAIAGETIVARMLKSQRSRGDYDKAADRAKTLRGLHEAYKVGGGEVEEEGDPYKSVRKFLQDALTQIEAMTADMHRARKNEESGQLSDIKVINEIAKVARDIDTFVAGYEELIKTISTFDDEDNITELGLPNKDAGVALAKDADKCLKVLNKLVQWRQATSKNILYYASRTVYQEDRVRGIGSKRDEVMSLTEILDHADRDINFVDRWLSAMSDADDAFLTLFDGIVKNQQYERDMEMIEINAQIAAADKKLRDAGYTSDFMYERDDDGELTLRIISPYDWKSYNDDFKKYKEYLRERNITGDRYKKQVESWKTETIKGKGARLIPIFIDPEVEKYSQEHGRDKAEREFPSAISEMVPNPKIYSRYASRIEQLQPAQREYYEEMMKIKRTMMTKIPHRGQGIYKVINISKDFVEGIIANTTGNPLKATLEQYKKKFLRRPDDIGFGTGENYKDDIRNIILGEEDSQKAAERILDYLSDALDEDVKVVIHSKDLKRIIDRNAEDKNKMLEDILEKISSADFVIIDTDFANHRIQRLPIYYTRPLRDKKMLSTDFSGCMVAYSAMAVNYEKMNEVIDILEVGRNYIKDERAVRETEGQQAVISRFSALGRVYKAFVERAGNGTNIAGRIDDYMDSVIYEERKLDAGTWEVLGVNLDLAKVSDAIKDYTGLLGLGFNLFSTVSNIAVGKLQQWIEAYGGEYFTFKDYAKAVVQYAEHIAPCMAEMASPVKKNKLSLLIQMFDPMGDYYESLRDPNFQKSAVARILGNGILAYVGMNAGEHMLHCQTMLAILNNIKLTNTKTKEKISLYDALEVKEVNGVYKLVLQDDLAYEKELIDTKGNKKSNKNYGRPIKDENGKIKTELVPISKPSDTIEIVHGGYSADDKGAAGKKTTWDGYKDYMRFIFKKKKIIRKVNDSLNGAFSVNDKGAAHRRALLRLAMQFRQWMPAHYMRRFARAHYDADLEQWREGYYTTVAKTINQLGRESIKAKKLSLKYYDSLSEHEKANLRRAEAEISEFLMLMVLCRLGGRVKDRDRSWLDKMALYQIHRMYLEVGASMPLNGGFFSNIFQLLQSPAASINTFEKISKVVQFWNMFDEIQTGRYQGWSEWDRDMYNLIPALGQITKAIAFDDSMFAMYEKED